MTRTTFSLAIAALTVATLSTLPTGALAKQKGVEGGAQLPMSTMAPLTASECERLGGDVIRTSNCKGTGKACSVNTLDNGQHMICINEAN
jgi:hypothetical protein